MTHLTRKVPSFMTNFFNERYHGYHIPTVSVVSMVAVLTTITL